MVAVVVEYNNEDNFRLALRVAEAEIRLRKLHASGAPPVIVGNSKKILNRLQLDLAENKTAQRLLPGARRFVRMTNAREESWEKMFGGQLKKALENLAYFYKSNGGICLKREVFDAPFEHEEYNEYWQRLRSVLDKVEGREIVVEAFLDLIRSLWVSYLYAEIPPRPE